MQNFTELMNLKTPGNKYLDSLAEMLTTSYSGLSEEKQAALDVVWVLPEYSDGIKVKWKDKVTGKELLLLFSEVANIYYQSPRRYGIDRAIGVDRLTYWLDWVLNNED